jgi:hypothetical protein
MIFGEIAPLAKAGVAATGFLLGVMGVAAGGALDQPGGLLQAPVGVQPQPTFPPGKMVLSSKLQSGEDQPRPVVEATQIVLPTAVVQPTPRPTFVPKPYSAPQPPTTPSQAEEQQKLQAMATKIADEDKKLHTVTFVPSGSGAPAQPRTTQATGQTAGPAGSAAPAGSPADQTDTTAPDQTDQADATDG